MMLLDKSWFHHRMLVVSNEELKVNGQGLYSRLWCVLEVFTALLYHIPIDFTCRSSHEHLFGFDSTRSVREARCGDACCKHRNNDEMCIRSHIEGVDLFIDAFRVLVPIY